MSGRGRPPRGRRGQSDGLPPTQQVEPAGDLISSMHEHSPDPPPNTQEQMAAPPVQPLADGDADPFTQAMMQAMQIYLRSQTVVSLMQPTTQSRAESRPPPPA